MCGCNLVTPRLSAAVRRSSSGSLAMLAAMRRASSRVRSFGRRSTTRLLLEVDVRERLPVGIADDS